MMVVAATVVVVDQNTSLVTCYRPDPSAGLVENQLRVQLETNFRNKAMLGCPTARACVCVGRQAGWKRGWV